MATSNAQRTRARGVIGVALAAFFAAMPGCLPGEHRPEGRQVLPGRTITGLPTTVRDGEGSLILFETPDATLPHDGRWRNLHAIPTAGGAPRKLIERSLTWFTPVRVGAGLVAALTTPEGAPAPVDPDTDEPSDRLLKLIDPKTGLIPLTAPSLINLSILRDGFAILAMPSISGDLAGGEIPAMVVAAFPELTLGDSLGGTRTFGQVTGTSFARDGAAFFTRAKDDSLMRIDAQRRSLLLLANGVDRFEATRDGLHALVTGLSLNDPVRGIDVAPAAAFPLPVMPDDCRQMFPLENAPTIVCLGSPQKLLSVATVNLERRSVGKIAVMAQGMPWLDARITPDQSHVVLRYQESIEVVDLATGAVQTVAGAIGNPRWNAAGTHVAVASHLPDLGPEGQPASLGVPYLRLAVLPGSFTGPTIVLSPEQWRLADFAIFPSTTGLDHVAVTATLIGERISLFASRLPPLSAFASAPSDGRPEIRLLASDVGRYATGVGRIVALTGLSSQDHTGDLMLFDLETGAAKLLATDVFDFIAAPPCPTCTALSPGTEVAFIVRTRRPLELEGLWVVTLP